MSVRLTELAVGLFADQEVTVVLEVHSRQPPPPEGAWEVQAQATLEVMSGLLGVRDVIADEPELVIPVQPGVSSVGVYGRWSASEHLFLVQAWPGTAS